MSALQWLSSFGGATITTLWIPLLIWTIVAIPIYMTSRYIGRKRPAVHYYAMVALLGSLLVGFVMEPVWNGIQAVDPTFATPELVLPIESAEEGLFFLQTDNAVAPESLVAEASEMSIPFGAILLAGVGGFTLLLFVWSLIGLLQLIYQAYQTRNIVRTLTPYENQHVQRVLAQTKEQVAVEKDVVLMKAARGSVPMTFGWRHPVIVVPEGVEKEPDVLKTVLYHELIHIKRKDYLVGVGTRCISVLFRFHPLVWVIDRSIQTYRELSCDNEVLRADIMSPLRYAHLLLRFNATPSAGYSIPMIQKQSVIKHRIKAMSEFTPSTVSIHRIVGWSALCVLLFLPAFFMACNIEAEQLEEPFVAPEGATVIDDLKLAFMLPEGWWQNGEPVIATSADLVEQVTPEQLEELKKTDAAMVTGDPDDLQTALYMYMYHNIPADQDSIPENFKDDLFYHILTFNVHTYYDKRRLARWSKGLCGKFPGKNCDTSKTNSNLELIRVLGPDENPFSEGTGFLYNVTRSEVPTLSYTFYLVRDGWAYRISYEITENELGDAPYPPLLDTIGFMN